MCGLVGFYPKKNKKADLKKIYSLWVLNEERGIHSCGISIGSESYKGINNLKKARNLIIDKYEDFTKKDIVNLPIITHTRHSTNGEHNEYNAHPFKWTSSKNNSYFIFAHNGSITNLEKIKNDFNLDKHPVELFKIDSHYLGIAMHDTHNNVVLEEKLLSNYEGNAAFLCYDSYNTFKVWKGGNNNTEERPLYYIENASGWYFCSIKEALEITFLKKPIAVDNNTLLIFKDYKLFDKRTYNRSINPPIVVMRGNNKYSRHNNYYSGVYNRYNDYADDGYTNDYYADDDYYNPIVKNTYKNNKQNDNFISKSNNNQSFNGYNKQYYYKYILYNGKVFNYKYLHDKVKLLK